MPLDEERLIHNAIAKYGPTLDLRNNPQALIDIVRSAQLDFGPVSGAPNPDAGSPPQPSPSPIGGTPRPAPEPDDGGTPPPAGPVEMPAMGATLDDVMAEVLRISRRVDESTEGIVRLRTHLGI